MHPNAGGKQVPWGVIRDPLMADWTAQSSSERREHPPWTAGRKTARASAAWTDSLLRELCIRIVVHFLSRWIAESTCQLSRRRIDLDWIQFRPSHSVPSAITHLATLPTRWRLMGKGFALTHQRVVLDLALSGEGKGHAELSVTPAQPGLKTVYLHARDLGGRD